MEETKAEEKKEVETGTSLFHQLIAQRKDVEEDVVCIKLQEERNSKFSSAKY